MARSKSTAVDTDTSPPTPPKATEPEGEYLVVNDSQGPYHHHRMTQSAKRVGGSVHAMNDDALHVWPGANYRPRAAVDTARPLRGFRGRLERREILIFDSWLAIPSARRLEIAKVTGDPDTLIRIIDEETDADIADAIQNQIDEAATNPRASATAQARRTARRIRGT